MMRTEAKIAPSILAADFARLGEEVAAICAAGCDFVHVDVMDGHFVPNITIGADIVAAIAPHATRPLDVHLMISPVEPMLAAFIAAGADIISFHPEATPHPHRCAQMLRDAGVRVGIALNPATPLSSISELLPMVDIILIMSVNPGFGGQKFIPETCVKLEAARAMIDASPYTIDLEVDGGITPQTASAAYAAGADILVAGTSVFKNADTSYADNIAALRYTKSK